MYLLPPKVFLHAPAHLQVLPLYSPFFNLRCCTHTEHFVPNRQVLNHQSALLFPERHCVQPVLPGSFPIPKWPAVLPPNHSLRVPFYRTITDRLYTLYLARARQARPNLSMSKNSHDEASAEIHCNSSSWCSATMSSSLCRNSQTPQLCSYLGCVHLILHPLPDSALYNSCRVFPCPF